MDRFLNMAKTAAKPRDYAALGRKGGAAKKGKSTKVMQERLADALIKNTVEGGKLTRSQILEIAGYVNPTKRADRAVWTTQGLQEALQRRGFTPEKVTRVLEEAADAKIVTTFHGHAKESNVADHAIRLRAVDQLGDLMGLKKINVQTLNVDVNMSPDEVRGMLGFDG